MTELELKRVYLGFKEGQILNIIHAVEKYSLPPMDATREEL